MAKKVLLPFVLIIIALNVNAKVDSLTAKTNISLITCGPGKEVYSHFGHSAIWVYDDSLGLDRIYNYGMFDFDDPNFIMKFVKGKLLYKLGVTNINRFMAEYVHANRSVREQLLNLTLEQKQKVYEFLEINYLPENRYYLYDFYFDNCATRIRDVFENILKDSLQLNYEVYVDEEQTYRQLLKPDLAHKLWMAFGIDIILGMPTDKIAQSKDYTFLPDFMEMAFEGAVVKVDSAMQPFVVAKRELYKAKPVKELGLSIMKSPVKVLWAVFAFFAIIFFFLFRAKRKFGLLDFLLWLIPTVLGFVVGFLVLFSDHSVVQANLNLIWANPLHFFFIWGLLRKNSPKWVKKYFKFYGIILILFVLSMSFIPQYFNPALIPILLILILSSLRIQREY